MLDIRFTPDTFYNGRDAEVATGLQTGCRRAQRARGPRCARPGTGLEAGTYSRAITGWGPLGAMDSRSR